jgi:two-component system chemotaxis response regulator CheY
MKIMVLDDNPEILSMVTIMLHNAYGQDTCEVVAGRNGQEGLELLKDEDASPDLILTNLRMPQMDGMTFLGEVRDNTAWSSIRLVMMSAQSSLETVNKAKAGGAEAFLGKPFTYRDLTTTIDDILAS